MRTQGARAGAGRATAGSRAPRPLHDEGAGRAVRRRFGDRLTAREQELLLLLADGFSNKQIGARLHLSHKTVDTHRTNLMGKLELHSVTGLVKYTLLSGRAALP